MVVRRYDEQGRVSDLLSSERTGSRGDQRASATGDRPVVEDRECLDGSILGAQL